MGLNKGSNGIGRMFAGANQIGKAYKGSVLVYSGEEKFTKRISNTYYRNGGSWIFDNAGNPIGWTPSEDRWSAYTVGSIDLPVGETFRIDSLTVIAPNSATTEIVLFVNDRQIIAVNPPGNKTTVYGPYPGMADVYTSQKANGTIQFKIRGKASINQWSMDPTGSLTIAYTTGV